ncbi:hypothetical protein Sfulv_58400 [Streptomyces fulvorobeus]|uniref:DUF985 domain-containing protein n=1 Tax=Streptomyces fulvorobeus TaxID=284028 RepID=A0A7J0CEW1_9ACTN|nr:hypothetical protein Sfulv_58400 [Streptomyces fulvorobeus]
MAADHNNRSTVHTYRTGQKTPHSPVRLGRLLYVLVATDGTFDGVGRQTAEPGGDEPVLVSCVVAPGFDFADLKML